MKNLFLSCFIFLFSHSFYSQSNNYKKLVEVYGEVSTDKILENNINKAIYYDVLLNSSFFIFKLDDTRGLEDIYGYDLYDQILYEQQNTKIKPLEKDISYFLSSEFNLLRFNLYRDIKNEVLYKIGDTGYVIKLISSSQLNQLYNSKI
jgi:hypothetical protein